jgi:hypothetical protein
VRGQQARAGDAPVAGLHHRLDLAAGARLEARALAFLLGQHAAGERRQAVAAEQQHAHRARRLRRACERRVERTGPRERRLQERRVRLEVLLGEAGEALRGLRSERSPAEAPPALDVVQVDRDGGQRLVEQAGCPAGGTSWYTDGMRAMTGAASVVYDSPTRLP